MVRTGWNVQIMLFVFPQDSERFKGKAEKDVVTLAEKTFAFQGLPLHNLAT